MLNNHKGFSLIEVLAALAIFAAAAATALPILNHVYQERMAIQEEREALAILQNRIQLMLLRGTIPTGKSETIQRTSTVYQLMFEAGQSLDEMKICIAWTARNERRYQKCGYAKIRTDTP